MSLENYTGSSHNLSYNGTGRKLSGSAFCTHAILFCPFSEITSHYTLSPHQYIRGLFCHSTIDESGFIAAIC
jgi:hypothetical protein